MFWARSARLAATPTQVVRSGLNCEDGRWPPHAVYFFTPSAAVQYTLHTVSSPPPDNSLPPVNVSSLFFFSFLFLFSYIFFSFPTSPFSSYLFNTVSVAEERKQKQQHLETQLLLHAAKNPHDIIYIYVYKHRDTFLFTDYSYGTSLFFHHKIKKQEKNNPRILD